MKETEIRKMQVALYLVVATVRQLKELYTHHRVQGKVSR